MKSGEGTGNSDDNEPGALAPRWGSDREDSDLESSSDQQSSSDRRASSDQSSTWSRVEPGVLLAIRRGLRRRCPRCGQAPIFERFITVQDRCVVCGLRFEERPGDTWGFWVLLDRVFIAIPFVILLFGFATASLRFRLLLIGALLVPLITTMPHRQGVAIALDYLMRRSHGPA